MRTAALALVAFVALVLTGCDTAGPGATRSRPVAAAEPAPGAEQVTVGFYPLSLYEFDIGNNTYFVDTYVWLRWRGDIDPTATLEFVNMVAEWSKTIRTVYAEPKVLPDGSKYQQLRVDGRFVQPFSLADFPFDEHHLSIVLEDTTYGIDKLAYVIDRTDTRIGDSLKIAGWQIDGWSARAFAHDYQCSFGAPDTASTYSSVEFSIDVRRPISFFLWKLFLPLLFVLFAAFAVLLLSPMRIDARTGLPAGALLTAIFLQKGYADVLPDVGYLILMDKIYLVAYALILVTLVRTITAYRSLTGADEQAVHEAARLDRRIAVGLLVVFLAATGLLVGLQ